MLFDPLAPTVPLELGGKKYHLVFDVNTFTAYEEATGMNFFDTLNKVTEFLQRVLPKEKPKDGSKAPAAALIQPIEFLKVISMKELRGLVWAAIHEYQGGSDEPVWPLTLVQVGKAIHLGNVSQVVFAVLTGNALNYPSKEDRAAAGESQGAAPESENEDELQPIKVAPLIGDGGGTGSGQPQQ